jgi:hypothetical protein
MKNGIFVPYLFAQDLSVKWPAPSNQPPSKPEVAASSDQSPTPRSYYPTNESRSTPALFHAPIPPASQSHDRHARIRASAKSPAARSGAGWRGYRSLFLVERGLLSPLARRRPGRSARHIRCRAHQRPDFRAPSARILPLYANRACRYRRLARAATCQATRRRRQRAWWW